MTIRELNKEQLEQVKINYYDNKLIENDNRNISYSELADINNIVSDDEIINQYIYTEFVDEDFFN